MEKKRYKNVKKQRIPIEQENVFINQPNQFPLQHVVLYFLLYFHRLVSIQKGQAHRSFTLWKWQDIIDERAMKIQKLHHQGADDNEEEEEEPPALYTTKTTRRRK